MAVVQVINALSARTFESNALIRHLVLTCLCFNIIFRAVHVPGRINNIVDSLPLTVLDIPQTSADGRLFPDSHTRGGVATWPPELWNMILGSLSVNIRKSYLLALQEILRFLGKESLEEVEWPLPVSTLLAFVMHCKRQGKSRTAVSNRLAGISFFSRLQGFPSCSALFPIKRAMLGWARESPPGRDGRKSITIQILRNILKCLADVCSNEAESLLFKCAFSLAFYAALRVSELAAHAKHGPSTACLQWEDTKLEGKKLIQRVPRSKTDQLGAGAYITLHEWQGETTCPVHCTRSYLQIRRSTCGGPLLVHLSGLPLTRYQFARVLHLALTSLGMSTVGYSSHSFRIGAVTAAAGLGLQDSEVMAIGRWGSGRFRSYVRLPGYFAVKGQP
ncbi:uncharacterized protein LOC115099388 isoform X2 [Rhinatrema bivittatum]|uniref:uncharacterized protein LOC115099388 isoform X2 n=1 Tax=Rhinatrema bivittatum TaxID=194408 RepID=UPI001128B5C7|nr:uncharacterized protein LOC115099388 isoform X2 [Rhinatrema bivittatum]